MKKNSKIMDSEVPYVELFGVDGMGRGRPNVESDAYRLSVGRRLRGVRADQVGGDKAMARKLTGQASRRAVTVLKFLWWDDFVSIFNKEKAHLIGKQESVQESVSDLTKGENDGA